MTKSHHDDHDVDPSLNLSFVPAHRPRTRVPASRRSFLLRSAAATIALPFMESVGFRRFASAAPVKTADTPKRMIFLGTGFGVTGDEWYPDARTPGYDYVLPELLSPLTKHKDDITLFQNLEHANSKDGHSGSTFWLTGADRYAVPGQSFHNTVSVDQVAAEQFGRDTRYASMVVFGDNDNGHGPGSISWNRQGKPIAGLPTPVALYHKMFSSDSMPLAERQALLADDRSALDTVISDARAMKKTLTKTDIDKLDEYFQSIRELEIRIAKDEQWLNVPKRKPTDPIKEPSPTLEGAPAVEMMYDLMLAAMQVDACRVFSYRLPGDSFLESIGSSFTAHNISHHAGGERTADARNRDKEHATLLSKFIDKMKATKEADGSSLYDNVTLAFGSNLRLVHSLNNCPTLITGGGAGFQHGRHLVMEKKTPLCNLWLSMLRGSGVNVDSFGDATGVIDELFTA
ncbi:Protein of unknown function [Neorhodopirellula lusitana]|uniref:Secreted protein containing DUF1552 n=1 Tax=Neorhodopirellula lusitana TaxID=445327 RepID=A0ABY1PU63_9BACT|nr:DUF1552 domain-containing protein [Neorhodopirellula lusitana]SMP42888.1 Protein of unknown function [Neorhodopirellula lusitana]